MKITIKQIKHMIHEALLEFGTPMPPTNVPIYNPDPIEQMHHREESDDELQPHLRDFEDPDDCFGPVPPTKSDDFYSIRSE